MNKKLAILAVACTVLVIFGGINTTILYGTQYLSSKPIYNYSISAGVDWWDCNWSHCKKITIDHTKVQSDQTNFPVLIYCSSDSDLAAYAQADGDDIAFVDKYNTTQYDHEIEKYYIDTGEIPATAELVAWVEIPSLSSSEDTILYMYYGNPSASNKQNVTATWDSNFKMVQHLNESSGTLYDSTSNDNDGTWTGKTSGINASSKIDGGYDFNGTEEHINCFDEQTEVLASNGWKLFKDLDRDDLIATLNPKTNQVEYHKPYRYIAYHYKGEMLQVKHGDVDLLVTPNHNMYVSRYNKTSNGWDEPELVRADEIYNENVRYKTEYTEYKVYGTLIDKNYKILDFLTKSLVENILTWDCFLSLLNLPCLISLPSLTNSSSLNCFAPLITSSMNLSNFLRFASNITSSSRRFSSLGFSSSNIFGSLISSSPISITSTSIDGGCLNSFARGKLYNVKQSGSKGHQSSNSCQSAWSMVEAKADENEWVWYDGMVYDVTVPNHILLVRRNTSGTISRPVWSGNCGTSTSLNISSQITLEAWVKDPPLTGLKEKDSNVRIADKKDEQLTTLPTKSFTVSRTVAADFDVDVIFAVLFSPGVTLNYMTLEDSSIFSGIYKAGIPNSEEEQDIEGIRKNLPEKLRQLGTIAYSKPFTIQHETTIQMNFDTEKWYNLFSKGRISYLVFSSDDSYDFEGTTHWNSRSTLKGWDPFSFLCRFIGDLINGDDKGSSESSPESEASDDVLELPPEIEADLENKEQARVIIRFKKPSAQESFAEKTRYLEDSGFIKTAEIDTEGLVAGFMDSDVFENIKHNNDIESVYPDSSFEVLLDESLPLIRYDEAVRNFNVTGKGTKICILDTGVDSSMVNISYGYDFVDDDSVPDDSHGHGTRVASVMQSIAPDAELIVAKVIDADGTGYESDVLKGLRWCIDQDPDVISFSIGSSDGCPGFCDDNLVVELCHMAVEQGIFVVAASGNDASTSFKAPACGSKVFSVGATDDYDNIAGFSNVNPTLDLFATGVDITTVAGTGSGTSMSTSFVAATAALVLENESLTPEKLKYRLRSTGIPIRYVYNSSLSIDIARLDVYNAVINNKTLEPYDYSWWSEIEEVEDGEGIDVEYGVQATTLNLDYTYCEADIYVTEDGAYGDDKELQMRWNISSIPANSIINDATLCLYITAIDTSVDSDTNASRINNQTWTESITTTQYNALPETNTTSSLTFNSTTASTWSCINVTVFVATDVNEGNDYTSFRIDDKDYPVDVHATAVYNTTVLQIGGVFKGNRYITFASKDYGTAGYRPWLNITYNRAPVFSGETPSNGSTNISLSTSTINVTINDPDGDTFNWTIETSPDIGSSSNSAWWNSSWGRRKPVYANVSSGETEKNHTVNLNITYDSDMNNNFSDLRFVRYADNTTLLDYWVESKSDGSWCNLWVEFRDNITTTNQTHAWMYYNNSGASSMSNGTNTFIFFDDFDDNSIDSTKWIETNQDACGDAKEEGQILNVSTVTGCLHTGSSLYTVQNFSTSGNWSIDFDYLWSYGATTAQAGNDGIYLFKHDTQVRDGTYYGVLTGYTWLIALGKNCIGLANQGIQIAVQNSTDICAVKQNVAENDTNLLALNTWYHINITVNFDTGDIKVYKDNVLSASGTVSSTYLNLLGDYFKVELHVSHYPTIANPEYDMYDNVSVRKYTSPEPTYSVGSEVDSTNGSKTCSITGLSAGTTYTWYVNASDGTDWTREWYTFTTNYAPVLSNPDPANGSTGHPRNPTLSVTVNDPEGDNLNISFWTNASGSWQQLGGYHEGNNGTYTDTNASQMNGYTTTYWWSVNVTDPGGSGSWTNETYHFTTGPPWIVKTDAEVTSTAYNNGRKLVRTSNGDLHCVYYRTSGGKYNIFYAKSTDSGEHWTETALTSDTSYDQSVPSIAVDSNDYLHVVWRGMHAGSSSKYQIRYINYTTGWSAIVNLTTQASYVQNHPSIAVDSNDYLHVVWYGLHADASFPQIRYINHTTSWNAAINLSSDTSYSQATPSIAVDSNDHLHVVWHGLHVGRPAVYQIRYINYTTGWSTVINLTNITSGNQMYPCLAVDSNDYLHVVWHGPPTAAGGDDQIRYTKHTTSWSAVENLTSETSYTQWYPSIAVDSNDYLHVVWHGRYEGTGSYQIRYINHTGSWNAVENLTSASAHQQYPNLMWANYPSSKFSSPAAGYAFVFCDNDVVKYYNSTGVEWNNAPVISSPNPSNESTGHPRTPTVNITVSDADGGTVTVRFYENSSGGGWVLQQTNSSVDVTSPANVVWNNYSNATEYKTMYWWKVNISDGAEGYDEEIYHFTTGPPWIVKTDASTTSTSRNNGRKLVRTSNGDLHCVYQRGSGGKSNIFYAKSTDNGEHWTETALTNDTSYDQYEPSIAVDSNNYLHVVWFGKHADSTNTNQIRYTNYTTGWSSVGNLTSGSYNQSNPAIAVDSSDNLHVVWHGTHSGSETYYQIRYMKYTAGWSSAENLTSEDFLACSQQYPSIAVDSNDYLHVVWDGPYEEGGVDNIRYRNYTTSWGAIVNVTNEGTYNQHYPCIAVDSNDYLHIVWSGLTVSALFEIRYRNYTTGWGNVETLTNMATTSYHQYYPSIAADSNDYLHVVWQGRVTSGIYQIRYTKHTTGWSAVENLTSASASQQYPSLIWALHPTVSGKKICRPLEGYAFVFCDDDVVKYYNSTDLSWNTLPGFSGETPTDGSTGVSISTSTINVTIEDPDGDTFNWTIETSPNIGSNSDNDASDGSKSCSISGLSSGTTYTWYVNATDGTGWTREWYTFATNYVPEISSPYPSNESIGISLFPTFNITVSDAEADDMNITFYSNATGSWGSFGSINLSANNVFGYNQHTGDNDEYVSIVDTIRGTWFTCPANGTADSITARLGYSGGIGDPVNITCALYYKSNNTLLNYTEKKEFEWMTLVGGEWVTFSFSDPKPTLVAGEEYYVVAWANRSTNLHYDTISNFNKSIYDTQNYNGFPDPLNPTSTDDRVYEIYVSYTTSSTPNGTYYMDNFDVDSYNTKYWWNVSVNDGTDTNNSDIFHFTTVEANKEIISKDQSAYSFEINPDGTTLYGYVNDVNVSTSIDTSWHYVTLTYDGSQLKIYTDGAFQDNTSLTGSIPTTANNLTLGKYLTGTLDEVRISSTARSAAWINTTYLNTNSPTTFATFGSQAGILSTWTYRKKITINHSLVDTTLTDFPVLISTTDTDLKNNALSTGNDIMFVNASVDWTSGSTTDKLDHEIEKYDDTTGELVAWVKIPSLSNTTDTEIYMYYGNSICTSNRENPTGVWDSNYKMVQHLEESTGSIADSTSNDNNGTNENATYNSSAQVDGAYDFNGSSDYIEIPDDTSIEPGSGNFTITAWIKCEETIAVRNAVIMSRGSSGAGFECSLNPTVPLGRFDCIVDDGPDYYYEIGTTALYNDQWHYIAFVWDTYYNDIYLYLNGTLETMSSNGTNNGAEAIDSISGDNVCIGSDSTGSSLHFIGIIDEVRISNIARNASWINTSYNTMNDPGNFTSFGSQEIKNVAPTQSSPSPSDGATGQSLNPELSITVNDTNADSMNVTFRTNATGTWGDIGSNNSVYNGTYYQTNSSMDSYNTTYYWSVNVTDGTVWTNATYNFTTYVNLTLRPNANGSVTQLSRNAEDANYKCVDEETANGDTDYVYVIWQATWLTDVYNLTNHTAESGSINYIKVYANCSESGDSGIPNGDFVDNQANITICVNNSLYTGSAEQLTLDSWIEYNHNWTSNPDTGSAWTWSDIDDLEAGVSLVGNTRQYARCTQVYIEVVYTP